MLLILCTLFAMAYSFGGLPPEHCLGGGYKPVFTNRLQLEEAIQFSKTTLENNLKDNLNLIRVSNPLFVTRSSGFNDNINCNVERPSFIYDRPYPVESATFEPRNFPGVHLEMPNSLAKWKRWALHYYDVEAGKGIITDFHGLRCDDDVDYTHSLYVDQFDWEKTMNEDDCNIEYLKTTVKSIYKALYDTEQAVCEKYGIEAVLPKEIVFVTSDDIIKENPHASPKQREDILCEKHKAVFLVGIGGMDEDGKLRHDTRGPDYDDWITERPDGKKGLNGDLLIWNPVLKQSFELSSIGIRVTPEVLLKQLDLCGVPERKHFVWHKMLLDGTLPQSIGGGIGQSRTCQFLLRACHIGEVQHGWYNPLEVEVLKKMGVQLLGLGEFEPDPSALDQLELQLSI